MKKIFLFFLLLCSTVNINAQFIAGFGCEDPDAWFDKEIYFYCQNQATNMYGYGMNLSNISLVIDGEMQVDFSGMWYYGDFIFLSEQNGFDFEKGSTVALYVNGYYQCSWTCNERNPSAWDVAKRAWSKKPRTKIDTKGLLKIIKKIKL